MSAPSARPDPRKLMQHAVQVMRQSPAEPRADGKETPRVGAVLWQPTGDVASACRGELRAGDHAEYTLLDRKLRDVPLDRAVLFSTLEPCAPGARQEPKLSCAERIVRARIKEVWIGIEDPDPTVDRKGIRYLQSNGVTVHLFDADIQQQIRDDNEAFLRQAMARAEAWNDEDTSSPAMPLSALEEPLEAARYDDLSQPALDQYRQAVDAFLDHAAFARRLQRIGLMHAAEDGASVPTGFGYLLFGIEPRTAIPQAGVLGSIRFAPDTEDLRDFDGPQVFAPQQLIGWLRDKLPDPIDRSNAERVRLLDPFFEMVREAVVNAIIHRDYGIPGANCHVRASPDSVRIMSPGLPVEPITLQQMQALDAPMLSRNPALHYVFSQMRLAEERGLGLSSLRRRAGEAGLPLPRYRWESPYLVLTIYRNAEALALELRGAAIMEELNAAAVAAWRTAALGETITTRELTERTGFDERKAQRALKSLVEARLLRAIGNGRATRYAVPRAMTVGGKRRCGPFRTVSRSPCR